MKYTIFVLLLCLYLWCMLCGCGRAPSWLEDNRIELQQSCRAPKLPVRWANPSTVYVQGLSSVENVDVSYEDYQSVTEGTQAAINTWNAAVGKTIVIYGGVSDEVQPGSPWDSLKDKRSVIYLSNDWKNFESQGEHPIATTYYATDCTTGDLAYSDMALDTHSYRFQRSITLEELNRMMAGLYEDREPIDSETVILHELGHLLGLDHIDENEFPDSVMIPYVDTGILYSKRTLSDLDIENIQSLYGDSHVN